MRQSYASMLKPCMQTAAPGPRCSCLSYWRNLANLPRRTFNVTGVEWFLTCHHRTLSIWTTRNELCWPKFTSSIIALSSCRVAFCSPMESQDMVGDQDMQMIQAFKEMGPLLDQFIRSKDDERDTKKQKKQHQDPDTGPQAARLLRLMGTMLIRLDADQQLMRKQDS